MNERLETPTTTTPRSRHVAGRTSRDPRIVRRRRAALFARLAADLGQTSSGAAAKERGWPLPIC